MIFSVSLTGCAGNQERVEGVTFAAGDAIAANTAMQIIDPWPRNVQHVDIAVPANREQYQPDETSGAQADTSISASATGTAYQ